MALHFFAFLFLEFLHFLTFFHEKSRIFYHFLAVFESRKKCWKMAKNRKKWVAKKCWKIMQNLAEKWREKVLENWRKNGQKSARKMTKNRWKKVLRNRQKSATKSPREFPDMTTAAQTAATRRTGLPGMMSWRVERAVRRVAAVNWREPRLLVTRSSSGDPTSPSEGTRDQLKGRSTKRRGMARGNQGARKNGPQRRFY